MAETKDNLAFWKRVQETDPAHTKHVGTRGGFTAIDAHYQVMCATKEWGPVGGKWWWQVTLKLEAPAGCQSAAVWRAGVELFTPLGMNPIVQIGCKSFYGYDGKPDEDAPKKAVTDGLTKCFSYLGFNADVFLGKFDDNKYVTELKKKYAVTEHATGAQISKIQNLSAKLKESQAADYVQVILGRRGLKSINELTPKQATDWIKTLENSLMEPIEGDGNEGTQ